MQLERYARSSAALDSGPVLAVEPRAWIPGLSLLTAILAVVATVSGIVTARGAQHWNFVSLGGVTVSIQGGGVYGHESVSMAAQAIGQDWVTLLIGVPLLLLATYSAGRGSLRGQLLRVGVLWYFAYSYLMMAFGAAYNQLFLMYVVIFSASGFAFVLAMLSIDTRQLPSRFGSGFHRRAVAWLMIALGVLLGLMWLGRIGPSVLSGAVPPSLESSGTLFVQAADLGLGVPLAILAGVLMLQSRPAGYLLAAVVLIHGATFGFALVAMVIGMLSVQVQVTFPEIAFSLSAAILLTAAAMELFGHVGSRDGGAISPGTPLPRAGRPNGAVNAAAGGVTSRA